MPALTLPLANVVVATPRSRLLALDLEGQAFPFRAGQAVLMGPHGAAARRPFSIALSPSMARVSQRLELLIGADAGTELHWAAPSALVDIEGPLGSFTYDSAPPQPYVVFVAGGIGISPLRSMIQHALDQVPAPTITLLYSARRSDEFAFIDEFRAYAQAGRLTLHQTVTRHEDDAWHGHRGRVGRGEFEALVRHPTATTCFVCGPAALVNETVDTLGALGVPRDAVRIERWGG